MDAFEHLLKAGDFTLKMPDACWGDPVGADLAVAGGSLPLCLDKIFFQHALQCGVERAFLHLEEIVGALLDVLNERVAVHRLALQRLEDHHFERAAEEIALAGLGRRGHRLVLNKPRVKQGKRDVNTAHAFLVRLT